MAASKTRRSRRPRHRSQDTPGACAGVRKFEHAYAPVDIFSADEEEAVHQLEWVPFRINEEFLDLVQKLDKDTATRVIQSIPPDYDKRRKALDRKYKTKGLQKVDKKYQTNKPLTEEENRKRKTWWREHYVLEEQKRAFESRRVKFEQDLRAAENLRGKRFFHRLKMCHRGRIYYPEFSYQGSDFARAVIEFADGTGVTNCRKSCKHRKNMVGAAGFDPATPAV